MVTLINVTKENNIVYAGYFPEDNDNDVGNIAFDINKKEVIDKTYCKKDEKSYLKSYFKKALRAINECIENNDFPKKKVYMWY